MLLQLTTIALVWASGSALPAPGATTQYVFLAPQIQRFAVQPAYKYPSQIVQTVVPTATKIDSGVVEKSTVQYAYAYPQYYVLRQDEEPWYTGIQNWFQGLGGSGEDAGEAGDAGESGDSVETDAPVRNTATNTKVNVVDANKVKFVEKSDKFVYLTPASTTVLNPERRFFILPEQQKIFGSISGPALNPVFTLQPFVSRSSSSSIAAAEPAVVLPDNHIPNIPAVVQQPNFLKSRIEDGLKAANEVPQDRVAPVHDVQNRAVVEVNDDGSVVSSLPVVAASPAANDVQPKQLFEPAEPVVAAANIIAQPSAHVENIVKHVSPVPVNDVIVAKRDIPQATLITVPESAHLPVLSTSDAEVSAAPKATSAVGPEASESWTKRDLLAPLTQLSDSEVHAAPHATTATKTHSAQPAPIETVVQSHNEAHHVV